MGAVTIPILPSRDFEETARFYAALGFAESGRWPGDYLILRRPDGVELHFWHKRDTDPRANDVACYIRLDSATEARSLHHAWAGLNLRAGYLFRPVPTDYGMLEFAVVDPHGNLVRIGGPLRAPPP